MSNYAINTVFGAKDRVTKIFSRMAQGSKKFGDDTSRSFRKASKSASSFKKILAAILASSVIVSGFGALQSGVSSTASQFVSFDDAIISASAKFKGLDLTTQAGIDTLNQLKKTARDVGAGTEFSATEAGLGLDFLAMAGFNAGQSMAALPGVVDLATVAKVDLARATDIASDSLGAFNLMTSDNVQLQKNLTRVNDVMARTMTRTNTGLEDLFEAAKKGAPTFTSTGQSMESFNAMLGFMANAGVKGEEAGTQLRNVMLQLANPVGAAEKAIQSLGLKTKDQHGNFRDVLDIMSDLEKGLKGYGTQQRAAALETIFGKRAITGVNILLASGVDNLKAFRKELEGSAGASAKMAEIMRSSLGNKLKALKSAAIELTFKFYEAFKVRGSNAIDAFTNFLRKADVQPLIDGVKTAISVFKWFYNVISPIKGLFTALIAYYATYAVLMKGAAIISAIKNFYLFSRAIRSAVLAQGALNTVMMLNPIGLIITAVAALVAVGVLLYKNWDKVTATFSSLWDWFNKLLDNPLIAAVSTIFAPFITIPALIMKHWEPITEFFGGMFDKLSALGNAARKFFGIGDDEVEVNGNLKAPNATEIEARQTIGFNGRLDIAGAPAGSTVTSKTTGAPPIQMDLVGVNL